MISRKRQPILRVGSNGHVRVDVILVSTAKWSLKLVVSHPPNGQVDIPYYTT